VGTSVLSEKGGSTVQPIRLRMSQRVRSLDESTPYNRKILHHIRIQAGWRKE
jgi:hypothetical protein